MWPRIAELTLACWLIGSLSVFAYYPAVISLVVVCSVVMVGVSLSSVIAPIRFELLHFVNFFAACGLVALGLVVHYRFPEGGAFLNSSRHLIVVGIITAMMGVLPNEAGKPPLEWRKYLSRLDVPVE